MVLGPHSERQGKMAFLSGAEQRETGGSPSRRLGGCQRPQRAQPMGNLNRRNGVGLSITPQRPQGESAHKRQRQGPGLGMQKEKLSLHGRGRGKAYFFPLLEQGLFPECPAGGRRRTISQKAQDSVFTPNVR